MLKVKMYFDSFDENKIRYLIQKSSFLETKIYFLCCFNLNLNKNALNVFKIIFPIFPSFSTSGRCNYECNKCLLPSSRPSVIIVVYYCMYNTQKARAVKLIRRKHLLSSIITFASFFPFFAVTEPDPLNGKFSILNSTNFFYF